MTLYALGGLTPTIHPDAFVHPQATVIGAVTLAAGVSVWPQAVLRGDYGTISVGERTSVQDGTVLHCTQIHPTTIGADCVLGHLVHVEGATIGDGCLIASGSVVLNGAQVGDGAVVGAGAVVSFNGSVPARSMALGVPARIRPDHQVPEGFTAEIVATYLANVTAYRDGLVRLD